MDVYEYHNTETEKSVKGYMALGYAPSQIDEMLNLLPGTSHDIVVYCWRRSNTGIL